MAVPIAVIPEGTRVRVRRAHVPQDPSFTGRTATVVSATEYRAESLGVVFDGDPEVRFFMPAELEVIQELTLPPEREQAKSRRALP
ncbi:MAG: hypothetical protein ACREMQ_09360 [Longimicrobiales bacterium]